MIPDRCLGAVCIQLQRVLAMKTHIKSIYSDLVAKQTNGVPISAPGSKRAHKTVKGTKKVSKIKKDIVPCQTLVCFE